MQVYESITAASLTGPTYLTIGNFDGVHRGHRALIAAMRDAARAHGAACGLLTFHPHPRSILRPAQPVAVRLSAHDEASLASLYERLTLFNETGLDFVIIHPFTADTAQTEPEEFLHLLHGHLGLSQLWLGPDFALGRGRRGTVAFLRETGANIGIDVHIFPEFSWEGQAIRSSGIRRLLEIGNIEWANAWLGRFYAVPGVIVHGARRGQAIGFPTANLSLAAGRVAPANGVYATWAWIDDQRYPSVTNIGIRPTVSGSHRTVEAHLIDSDGDFYGRCARLEFITRLRDELKFPSLDALTAQIARDRDRAAHLLAQNPQIPLLPRFEEIPHTADWAIRVIGASQAELFANAAIAMFSLQGATEIDGPTLQQLITIDAIDPESLLVSWLSQLLWHAETQQVTFQNFWIEALTDTHLQAVAVGRYGRSDLAHIKAVTYHGLSISPPTVSGTDTWVAHVLFDT